MVVVRAEEGTTDLAKVCRIRCVCDTCAVSGVRAWGWGWSRYRIEYGLGLDSIIDVDMCPVKEWR